MDLQSYLDRIGYSGTLAPTLSCLTAIHRLQAFTIPYENLDIQLGRRVDRDRERIFEKVVRSSAAVGAMSRMSYCIGPFRPSASMQGWLRQEFTGMNLEM